ncbi:peptide ABC transporter substrate-binding protein [Xylophilus rhododendri]|uniref:Peptide ABC transporter substrate-binding protein n=1 Tax=Xylophilus rhododendri TaxID=2697032 RepID=A0A857J5H9_9BURK|nr:ABC transporter substrate-binding protein [Xylophilus rhododendri]QHI98957.1 peptide ABC transporter substrate-binding protein [Xylophilus rhododendri]
MTVPNPIRLSLCALALLAGAAAPGLAGAQTTLRTMITADLRTVMPGANTDDNHGTVLQQVYEGLVASRADGTVEPMLAAKIDTSADGLNYTFTLRDGVKFHNGAPLTAKEVVWTWNYFLDPAKGPWQCRANFDGSRALKVESVRAADDRHVVFKLAQPYGAFLGMMARGDCDGTGIAHPDSVVNGVWTTPIGTGPFKWAEWKRGEYVELARNPDYRSRSEPSDGLAGAKAARVDRLRFTIVPDPAAARAAVLAGNLDVWPSIDTKFAKEMEATGKVRLSGAEIASVNSLVIQTADPLLADKRIRQALNLAVDNQAMVDAVLDGYGRPATSAIPLTSRYYGAAEKKGLAYNIPLARKLLAEAGYKGQSIKLTTNSRFQSMQDIAVLYQALAREAGINIEVEVVEWAVQLDRYFKGSYQMMVWNFAPQLDALFVIDRFTGDKSRQADRVWGNPQASQLLARIGNTASAAERQPLFDQLHQLFVDDAPMIAWSTPRSLSALSPKVKGFQAWAGRKPRYWNVELSK